MVVVIVLVTVDLVFINDESDNVVLGDGAVTTSGESTAGGAGIVVLRSNDGALQAISIGSVVIASRSITVSIIIISSVGVIIVSVSTLVSSSIVVIVISVGNDEDSGIQVTDVVIDNWRIERRSPVVSVSVSTMMMSVWSKMTSSGGEVLDPFVS